MPKASSPAKEAGPAKTQMTNRILSHLSPSGQGPRDSRLLASNARSTAAGISRLAAGLLLEIEATPLPNELNQRWRGVVESAVMAASQVHRLAVAVENEGGRL